MPVGLKKFVNFPTQGLPHFNHWGMEAGNVNMVLCFSQIAELTPGLVSSEVRGRALRQVGGMCHPIKEVVSAPPFLAGGGTFGPCKGVHEGGDISCPPRGLIRINALHVSLPSILGKGIAEGTLSR